MSALFRISITFFRQFKMYLFLMLFLLVFLLNCKGTSKDTINTFVTKEGFKTVIIALKLYHKEFGQYPQTLDELLLKKGITDRSIIEDAWGRPYYYVRINDSYKIFSLGRDGKPFTRDDVYPPSKR